MRYLSNIVTVTSLILHNIITTSNEVTNPLAEWIINGRSLDIYQPISSKTAQLPTETVKDDRPIFAKKD